MDLHQNARLTWHSREALAKRIMIERLTAFDSSTKKRKQSRSNPTGQQPDARSKEFIPPFGDATQPKSPALRFAIRRATSRSSQSQQSFELRNMQSPPSGHSLSVNGGLPIHGGGLGVTRQKLQWVVSLDGKKNAVGDI